MELKKGMYVRYTRGAINGYVPPKIAKIVDCSDNDLVSISNKQVILQSDVIKASDNLIDLIEEGDYVNGNEVENISSFRGMNFVDTYMIQGYGWGTCIPENEIKSIVTREQFESMKYIVESE